MYSDLPSFFFFFAIVWFRNSQNSEDMWYVHGCSLVGLWCATRSSPRSSKKRLQMVQGLPEKWAEKDLPSHISSRLQRLFIPPEVNLGEKFVFISHDMFMFSWGKSLYLGLEWSKNKKQKSKLNVSVRSSIRDVVEQTSFIRLGMRNILPLSPFSCSISKVLNYFNCILRPNA